METGKGRSIGVTISAVVALLCSGLWLLFALLGLLGSLAQPPPQSSSASPLWAMLFGLLFMIAMGVWGVATAIGLLKLKRWARYSILIFSGFIAYTGLVSTVAMAFIPPPPEVPEEAASMVWMIASIVIVLPTVGIGAWWLYLFNKQSVKEQFPVPARSADRPVSVTVIAAFLIFGGVVLAFFAVIGLPVAILGLIVTGWKASLTSFVMALFSFYLGYGLIRLDETARRLAIWYVTYSIINMVLFTLLPGYEDRLATSLEFVGTSGLGEGAPAMSSRFYMLSSLQSVIPFAIAMWFLIARKNAFLDHEVVQPPIP